MDTLKPAENERRARVRRSAWILGVVALSFYIAFIWMSVARA